MRRALRLRTRLPSPRLFWFRGKRGGTPSPLPSERDQNFQLCDAQGRQAVLKIANALEEYALLEAQNGAR